MTTQLPQRPTHSWIAYKRCGCIHDCILDDSKKQDAIEGKLGEWLSKGYTIAFVENAVVTHELEREVCPTLEQGKREAAQAWALKQEVIG